MDGIEKPTQEGWIKSPLKLVLVEDTTQGVFANVEAFDELFLDVGGGERHQGPTAVETMEEGQEVFCPRHLAEGILVQLKIDKISSILRF